MKKIEKKLGKNKNTINFFGILIALFALIYSAYNTYLTNKAVTSDIQKFRDKNTPLFTFDVNRNSGVISSEKISIYSVNPDIALNKVIIYFNNAQKRDSFKIPIPLDYKLKELKEKITDELKIYHCDKCDAYSDFTCIPVGIKFNFFQFGKQRDLVGLFKLTSKIHSNYFDFGISFKHIEFLKYYDDKSVLHLWDDIENLSLNSCYKEKYKDIILDKVSKEKLKKDLNLAPLYELTELLSTYSIYNITYQPADSTISYKYLSFLQNDSLTNVYQKLISSNVDNLNTLDYQNVISNYKSLNDFLNRYKVPASRDLKEIIKSEWVKKPFNDSLTVFRDDLHISITRKIKNTP